MTPEEFKDALSAIQKQYGGDIEKVHAAADDLLCKVLRELGYGDGINIFEEMDKWYA